MGGTGNGGVRPALGAATEPHALGSGAGGVSAVAAGDSGQGGTATVRSVGESREPLLGERWAQKVSAETFEPNPVVGSDGAIGVEVNCRNAWCLGWPGEFRWCYLGPRLVVE